MSSASPNVPAAQAQQVVVQLLDLPDEVLKYITQYVPQLEALALTNHRLSDIAVEVNDERQNEWFKYFDGVTTNLDLNNVQNAASFDVTAAWILLADEYTTEVDQMQTGDLLPATANLMNALPGTITTGLQNYIGPQVSAQIMNHGEGSIDPSVSDAFDRLMKRWVD